MNLNDVMDELAVRLDTIDGLRVYGYPPDTLQPPAAIVTLPDSVSFDESYARGLDRITLPVVLVVAKPTDRTSRNAIAGYCSGTGTSSVKAVLEAAPHTSFSLITVKGIDFDVVTIGGTDYVAAMFNTEIVGSGS